MKPMENITFIGIGKLGLCFELYYMKNRKHY